MRERQERKDTFKEKTEVSVARLLSFSFNKGVFEHCALSPGCYSWHRPGI